ncbi:unnamed protein product [Closterium sp. Yama58-4]|nr:unnamed protein product [Closterium sp. Yama58-4]
MVQGVAASSSTSTPRPRIAPSSTQRKLAASLSRHRGVVSSAPHRHFPATAFPLLSLPLLSHPLLPSLIPPSPLSSRPPLSHPSLYSHPLLPSLIPSSPLSSRPPLSHPVLPSLIPSSPLSSRPPLSHPVLLSPLPSSPLSSRPPLSHPVLPSLIPSSPLSSRPPLSPPVLPSLLPSSRPPQTCASIQQRGRAGGGLRVSGAEGEEEPIVPLADPPSLNSSSPLSTLPHLTHPVLSSLVPSSSLTFFPVPSHGPFLPSLIPSSPLSSLSSLSHPMRELSQPVPPLSSRLVRHLCERRGSLGKRVHSTAGGGGSV